MSHFTVLVTAKDEDDLIAKLQPYHEFECTGESDQYIKDIDITDKVKEEYEEYKNEDQSLIDFLADDYGYDPIKEGECPDVEGSDKFGYVIVDDNNEVVKVIKRTNPNAKWDWWQVGGRWTGLLKLKDDFTPKDGNDAGNGSAGLMTPRNEDPTKCDYTFAKHVDWDAMLNDRLGEIMNDYKDYHIELIKVQTNNEGYTDEEREIITEAEKTWNDETSKGENCRKAFKSVRDWYQHCIVDSKLNIFMETFDEGATKHYKTEDEYRAMFSADALTFAFVDQNGKWNESAKMGFWAMTTNENDNYDKQFWEFVRSLNGEQRVYVVDCHI